MWFRIIISMFLLIGSMLKPVWANHTYYIYCENLQTKYWEWLFDNNGEYITVKGKWHEIHAPQSTYVRLLQISENSYLELKDRCQKSFGKNWEPHPGRNIIDHWYLFSYISKKSGRIKFSKGNYTLLNH